MRKTCLQSPTTKVPTRKPKVFMAFRCCGPLLPVFKSRFKLPDMRMFVTLLLLVSTLLISACKKFVDVPMPKNELSTGAVFEDSTGCVSAVNGIYIDMMQGFSPVISNGGLTIYSGLSADELVATAINTDQRQFYDND